MKRNTITLIIALLLGVLTIWLIRRQSSGTSRPELRDFAVSDTASITKIFLADKALKQVTLTKEADGRWKVDGKFFARPDAIKTLLVTIHDLSVREPVGFKADTNVIKALSTGGTKCEIYAGDKLIKQYYVGGETPDMTGTYMLLCDISDPENIVNAEHPFVMEIKGFNGYLTTRYFTHEGDWKDRTVFHYFVPDIRSIKVEHAGSPENSFVVSQSSDGKNFGLQNLSGQSLPFDTIPLKQFISYFGNIGFENFVTDVPQHMIDSTLHSTPVHTITITDASGKKNEIKMFLKKGTGKEDSTGVLQPYDNDRMYALVNNGQDFVLVQYYVFGKLLQTPQYFTMRKSPAKIPH
jgi:hypothetical protein